MNQLNKSKQQKLVLTDNVLTFLGEIIQRDPDSWGIMLTQKRGRSKVQLKFIQHLSKHTNPLTHGKTSTTETVIDWIKAGLELRRKQLTERMEVRQKGKCPIIKFRNLNGSAMSMFSIMLNGSVGSPQPAGKQLLQNISTVKFS
jgi:hypothetical protein